MMAPTSTNTTLDNALAAHALWKTKLLAAVESGEVLDVATIKRDDCCELGKWIYSDGKRTYGHKPEFLSLLVKHKEFHVITGIVAGIVNGKDFESAKAMMGGSSQFGSASMDVGMAIIRLKKATVG
jgi:hypothetical protein